MPLPQQLLHVKSVQVRLQELLAVEAIDQRDLVILLRVPHLSEEAAQVVDHHGASQL